MELGQLSLPGYFILATRTAGPDLDQFVNQIAALAKPVRVNLLMKTLLVINHFVRVLNEYVGEGPSLSTARG